MPNRRGRLFVISASSGTGKTTLAEALLKRDRRLRRSVTCTTRSPRAGEKHGVDYHFLSRKEFFRRKAAGGFLEWANVFGEYYGTPKKEVGALLRRGHDVLLLIDVQGARQVKKIMPEAVFIFLAPPSERELLSRLQKRGSDTKKEIRKRLLAAHEELRELNALWSYDYRIVNRDVRTATRVLGAVLAAETR